MISAYIQSILRIFSAKLDCGTLRLRNNKQRSIEIPVRGRFKSARQSVTVTCIISPNSFGSQNNPRQVKSRLWAKAPPYKQTRLAWNIEHLEEAFTTTGPMTDAIDQTNPIIP